MRRIIPLLKNPNGFFESTRDEGWKPSFKFFLQITVVLSIATPIVNYLGVESTDFSSAYQAQIMAYRLVQNFPIDQYGILAYFIEALLIFAFRLHDIDFRNGIFARNL